MKCPACGKDSHVLKTMGTQRRRECLHCKFRWNTLEVPAEEHHAAERAREVVLEAAAQLGG